MEIDLRLPVYCHGPLYVALSRVTDVLKVTVFLPQQNEGKTIYPEVLKSGRAVDNGTDDLTPSQAGRVRSERFRESEQSQLIWVIAGSPPNLLYIVRVSRTTNKSQVTGLLSLVTLFCHSHTQHIADSLRVFRSQTGLSKTKMVTKQVEKQW